MGKRIPVPDSDAFTLVALGVMESGYNPANDGTRVESREVQER